MTSIKYRMVEKVMCMVVKPMMRKAIDNPERFLKMVEKQQAKKLPLDKLHKKYTFEERIIAGTPCYVMQHPQYLSRDKHKVVLYFFGGGFFVPGNSGDFAFAHEMFQKTGADVWLVWYPLFPKVRVREIIDAAIKVYQQAVKEYGAEQVTWFGLSSGASLGLMVCTAITNEKIELPLPKQLILCSPVLRVPPIKEQWRKMLLLDEQDCMIPMAYLTEQNQLMKRFDTDTGYMMQPIFYSWEGFPTIYAFYGEKEVISVYKEELAEKCKRDNVPLKLIVGKEMMHTWMAAGFLKETKPARAQIYQIIRGSL